MLIPACRCGKEMRLFAPSLMPAPEETHVNSYGCNGCGSELHVTVWGCDALDE
jgi:hypothetical protein